MQRLLEDRDVDLLAELLAQQAPQHAERALADHRHAAITRPSSDAEPLDRGVVIADRRVSGGREDPVEQVLADDGDRAGRMPAMRLPIASPSVSARLVAHTSPIARRM